MRILDNLTSTLEPSLAAHMMELGCRHQVLRILPTSKMVVTLMGCWFWRWKLVLQVIGQTLMADVTMWVSVGRKRDRGREREREIERSRE